MATPMQLVIDCAGPDKLARFWAEALHYILEPPPEGFDDWDAYWRQLGVPDEELGIGADRVVDPDGIGPRIWFQVVPEPKAVKNRVHLDLKITPGRERASLDQRRATVEAEVSRLVALGATRFRTLADPGIDHYGVVLQDPEGNEFCVA